MPNGISFETLKRRCAALLNKAEGTQNEHEKDAFMRKAFKMMADYGLSEAELRAMNKDMGQVTQLKVQLSGKYRRQQIMLLARIAVALHCETTFKTHNRSATVVGVESHAQRVVMIFALLAPQMVRETEKAEPDDFHVSYYSRYMSRAVITREWRRSFALGFGEAAHKRLEQAETNMANSLEAKTTGADLVLVADAERANKELHRLHPNLKKVEYKRPGAGFYEGLEAGERADYGDRNLAAEQNRQAIG